MVSDGIWPGTHPASGANSGSRVHSFPVKPIDGWVHGCCRISMQCLVANGFEPTHFLMQLSFFQRHSILNTVVHSALHLKQPEEGFYYSRTL